ncbi:hypothetical protein ACTA71_011395 [Dictyostelium dimigraforme]
MLSRVIKNSLINKSINKNIVLHINRSYSSSNNGISTEISDLPIYYHRDLHSNKDIFMIGSIHASRDSATQVQKFIRDIKPQAVVLELDESRFKKIRSDIHNKDLSSFQAQSNLNQDNYFFKMLLGNLFGNQNTPIADVLTNTFQKFQNTLKTFGLIPGLEFYYAIKEAENLGSEIILGDVDSKITMGKILHALPNEVLPKTNTISPNMQRLNQILSPMMFTMMKDGVTEQEMEFEYKRIVNNKTLNEIRTIFEEELPITYEAVLIGRERHLTRAIKQSKANTIVVVVGALHVDGVKKLLNLPLDKIPKSLSPPKTTSLDGLLDTFGIGVGGGLSNMIKGLLEIFSKNWNSPLIQITLPDHPQEYQTLASFLLTRV